MNNKIIQMVNRRNWKGIDKIISSNKNSILRKRIVDGNILSHLLVYHNQFSSIKLIHKVDPYSLSIGDGDGNTILHKSLLLHNVKLAKDILKLDPKLINLRNNKSHTIFHIIFNNLELIKYIIDNYKSSMYDGILDVVDYRYDTILTLNIINLGENEREIEDDDTPSTNNNNSSKIIDYLLTQNISLDTPTIKPPLSLAVLLEELTLVKKLVKKGVSIHTLDTKDYLNVLQLTLMNAQETETTIKMIQYFIDQGIDVNYSGPEDEDHPLMIALFRNMKKVVRILMNHPKINLSHQNKFLSTPLHRIFKLDHKMDDDIIEYFIKNGDLNVQDQSGDTPLNIMIRFDDWKKWNSLLSTKKLDIFKQNVKRYSPLSYIKKEDQKDFINLTIDSYLHQLQKVKKDHFIYSIDEVCRENANSGSCRKQIMKIMLDDKRSYPITQDDLDNTDKFKFIKLKKAISGSFNADFTHNIIYTLIILSRNKSLFVPYKTYLYDEAKNLYITTKSTNIYKQKKGMAIAEIITSYSDYLFEIMNYAILWNSPAYYYIPKNLELGINRCLTNNNIRFVLIKLTMLTSYNSSHANMILIDKEQGSVERFDPYGDVPYLKADEMDDMFEKMFNSILSPYCKDNKLTYQYLRPRDYMDRIGFQVISNDGDYSVKKLGDPGGYCLAWCFWYIEMRVRNPLISPKELVNRAFDSILNYPISNKVKTKVNSDLIYLDYIRNYASDLDSLKNKFLVKAGVSKDKIYQLVFGEEDKKSIINFMGEEFGRIGRKKGFD